MSVLPLSRLFAKPDQPRDPLPASPKELLADIGRHLVTLGIRCVVGSDSLWAEIAGREVRVDVTVFVWAAMRPVDAAPVRPPSCRPESRAEFLARQHCEVAEQKAELARRYPLDGKGDPAWNPRRTLAELERAGQRWGEDATERDEALERAINDEPY